MIALSRGKFFLFVLFFLSTLVTMPCIAIQRDYNLQVEGSDKKNLKYLVSSLGRENHVKLLTLSGSLNDAGDSIRHIHPLRFLECIFTDEELKVAVREIPNKAIVGKKFITELSDSLNEEYSKGNMPDVFIQDFANNIHVNVKEIHGLIHQRKWKDFVMKLIAIVPRERGTNRYSM